jgi:hypothetical protein
MNVCNNVLSFKEVRMNNKAGSAIKAWSIVSIVIGTVSIVITGISISLLFSHDLLKSDYYMCCFYIYFLINIAGLITGIMMNKRSKKAEGKWYGLAVAGIAINIVALLILVFPIIPITWIWLMVTFGGGMF